MIRVMPTEDLLALCTLAQAGTLEINNPGVLGMGGGPASVNLRVVRLP